MSGDGIGRRIADMRKARGLSQRELAVEIGESRRNVEDWERGANEPSLRKAVKLARFFGCTIEELAGG